LRIVAAGEAQKCPNNDCGPRVINGRISFLGFNPNTGQMAYGHWEKVNITIKAEDGTILDHHEGKPQYVEDMNGGSTGVWHGINSATLSQTTEPIKPLTPKEIYILFRQVRDIRDYNPRRWNFFTDVINKVAEQTGVPARSNNIISLFRDIQKLKGFERGPGRQGAGAVAIGSVGSGDAKIRYYSGAVNIKDEIH
jgi:hypothetical protein